MAGGRTEGQGFSWKPRSCSGNHDKSALTASQHPRLNFVEISPTDDDRPFDRCRDGNPWHEFMEECRASRLSEPGSEEPLARAGSPSINLIRGKSSPMLSRHKLTMAILATLLVLFLCLLPRAWMGPERVRLIPHTDKIIHFGMFFLFAFFWARVADAGEAFRARLVMVAVSVVCLAITTEWAQGFPFVDRDPDVLDATADIVGGFAGLFAEFSLRTIRQQRRSLKMAEQ